ncbi:winged helix-turn-helix domain-containing protein [Pararhodospirillum photometricum]|uniref:winged helix-turn-helix domain-containing protein n=1 Tax=Pararhodospirillum photometricum TaxID=1084 RepID=UPI00031FB624
MVSKQDLSKRALGRPLTPYDRRIDVHISAIRQKLGQREDGRSWIQTVRGAGYQRGVRLPAPPSQVSRRGRGDGRRLPSLFFF